MSVLREKLEAAGVNTGDARIYVAACDALKKRSLIEALPIYVRMLKQDPTLLSALAAKHLREVADDMRRKPLGDQARHADDGHLRDVPDSSGSDPSGDHVPGASVGQGVNVADLSRGAGQSSVIEVDHVPNASTTGSDLADDAGQPLCADPARWSVSPVRETTVSEAGRILQTARKPGAGALQPVAYAFRQQVRGESWLLSHKLKINDRPFMSFGVGEIRPMAQRTVREGASIMRDLVLLYATEQITKKRRLLPEQTLEKTLTPADILEIENAVDSLATIKAAKIWIKDFAKEHVPHLENADD